MPQHKVLVIGGAGYVGCVLVAKLLALGHEVVVFDLMLFGRDGLPSRGTAPAGDRRRRQGRPGGTAGGRGMRRRRSPRLHLQRPQLRAEPRALALDQLRLLRGPGAGRRDAGVSRFVYASTSSVYGVTDAPEVTEEHPLVPVSDYNRYKAMSEPLLLRHQSPHLTTVIVRPATVCGYSPRMRLDLTVNILTNHALHRRQILVFGGTQKRPNIHIDDIAELYVDLLDRAAGQIAGEIYNAGHQNYTVSEIAAMVKSVVEQERPDLAPIEIETQPSNDPRSYHVSSRKIAERLGWRPRRTIEDAVRDLCRAFREGRLPNSFDDERYFNVKRVKSLGLR